MGNLAYKSENEVFAAMAPSKRVGALRLGFVILVILGLLAMLYVGYKLLRQPQAAPVQKVSAVFDSLVPTAYAQGVQPTPSISSAEASRDMRQFIMVGLFLVLALVLLMSVLGVLFGKDPTRVSVASDILKTVLGFFIGAATGLLH